MNLIELDYYKSKVENTIKKCKEEIKWANECLKEDEKIGGYTDEDRYILPHHVKCYESILELLT